MPKRTNEFQRLIAMIQSHLADGQSIEESKLLVDKLTGSKREVDVYIQGKIGSHKICISVECRDHARAQTVTWVDEMKSKHDRLETNVLVLYSSSGFSREAMSAAEKYGIKLVSQDAIADKNEKFHFSLENHILKYVSIGTERVELFVELNNKGELALVRAVPEIQLYDMEQKEISLLRNLVDKLLYTGNIGEPLLDNAKEEHTHFEVLWDAPFLQHENLFLHNTEWQQYHRLAKLRIVGTCKTIIQLFGMKGAVFDGTQVAWGKVPMQENTVLVAGTKDVSNSVKWSLKHIE